MSTTHLSILSTGLVTSVGLSAPATCAAMRAKLSNPSETRFIDSDGEWIMAHQVELDQPWRGLTKLAKMAAMAIEEALAPVPRPDWATVPLILCVADSERPGRTDGLDDQLFLRIEAELGARLSIRSAVVAHGRVSVASAMALSRKLLDEGATEFVLIAAVDSLVTWKTLMHFGQQGRLLTPTNSNGFMPGEGAGALLVGKSTGQTGELLCTGIGFAHEAAYLDSGEPLRGEGLSCAIKAALVEAACGIHDMDFRITDLAGEHYYFKEAALALSRTLRERKKDFDIWHPAECTGEVGAVSGATAVALADAACREGYAMGANILVHMAEDMGRRAALSLRRRV